MAVSSAAKSDTEKGKQVCGDDEGINDVAVGKGDGSLMNMRVHFNGSDLPFT